MDKNCLTLSCVLPRKVHKLCESIAVAEDLAGGALIPARVFPVVLSPNPPYVIGDTPIYLKRPDGKKYPALQLSGGDILVFGVLPNDSLYVDIRVQNDDIQKICRFLVSKGRIVTYLAKKADVEASSKPDFVVGD